MALAVKHNFVSSKADGTDATLLRPSNWNEDHTITLASKMLVGRQTAGSGAAEEIPCSAAAASVLAAADIAAILEVLGVSPPTTGDLRITLKTTAPSGWLMMANGSIGSATSGATIRANSDVADLYKIIWDGIGNTYAPIFTSAGVTSTRGASAAVDFAADKRLSLPWIPGRAIVGAGGGGSLTTRNLGEYFGVENKSLTTANLPPYTPSGSNGGISVGAGGNRILTTNGTINNSQFGSGSFSLIPTTNTSWSSVTALTGAGPSWAGNAQGGTSTAFSIEQPAIVMNVMVKL